MLPLGLRFVGHSTVRVELAGRVVLTDPVLTNRVAALTRVTAASTPADRADVDLVLLSHLHGDHVHLPSLRLLSPHVRVVAPRGSRDWLRSKGIRQVEELAPGEELVDGDLHITGVPATHSGHRLCLRRHRPVPGDGRARQDRRRAARPRRSRMSALASKSMTQGDRDPLRSPVPRPSSYRAPGTELVHQ